MNDAQFKLFLQELEDFQGDFHASVNDALDHARELYISYNALAQNCDILVEQLRESRSIAHKLREQLKKYEPETAL